MESSVDHRPDFWVKLPNKLSEQFPPFRASRFSAPDPEDRPVHPGSRHYPKPLCCAANCERDVTRMHLIWRRPTACLAWLSPYQPCSARACLNQALLRCFRSLNLPVAISIQSESPENVADGSVVMSPSEWIAPTCTEAGDVPRFWSLLRFSRVMFGPGPLAPLFPVLGRPPNLWLF